MPQLMIPVKKENMYLDDLYDIIKNISNRNFSSYRKNLMLDLECIKVFDFIELSGKNML